MVHFFYFIQDAVYRFWLRCLRLYCGFGSSTIHQPESSRICWGSCHPKKATVYWEWCLLMFLPQPVRFVSFGRWLRAFHKTAHQYRMLEENYCTLLWAKLYRFGVGLGYVGSCWRPGSSCWHPGSSCRHPGSSCWHLSNLILTDGWRIRLWTFVFTVRGFSRCTPLTGQFESRLFAFLWIKSSALILNRLAALIAPKVVRLRAQAVSFIRFWSCPVSITASFCLWCVWLFTPLHPRNVIRFAWSCPNLQASTYSVFDFLTFSFLAAFKLSPFCSLAKWTDCTWPYCRQQAMATTACLARCWSSCLSSLSNFLLYWIYSHLFIVPAFLHCIFAYITSQRP